MQVNAILSFKFIRQIFDQSKVEIFAAEKGIAIGCENLKLMLAVDLGNFNHRNVEGTAT